MYNLVKKIKSIVAFLMMFIIITTSTISSPIVVNAADEIPTPTQTNNAVVVGDVYVLDYSEIGGSAGILDLAIKRASELKEQIEVYYIYENENVSKIFSLTDKTITSYKESDGLKISWEEIEKNIKYIYVSDEEEGLVEYNKYNMILKSDTSDLSLNEENDIIFTISSINKYDNLILTNLSTNEEYAMKDDGDYENSGDDIKNDGTYSAKIKLSSSSATQIDFIASDMETKSNKVTISFFEGLSEETIESVKAQISDVESKYNELLETHGESEAKSEMYEHLETLESKGNIYDLSLSSENPDLINFTYKEGILGGFMLEEFDNEIKGLNYDRLGNEMPYSYDDDFYKSLQEKNNLNFDMEIPSISKFAMLQEKQNVVGNNNVLIISSMDEGHTFTQPYDTLMATLKDTSNFNVTRKYNATLDDFKNLKDYGSIFVDSHGSFYKNTDPVICLEETATALSMEKYDSDIKAKRVAIIGGKSNDVKGGSYWILPKFFNHYYNENKLPDSFVHLGICLGLYNNNLSNSLLQGGAKTIHGYTDVVTVGYDKKMLISTVSELLENKTTDEARMSAINVNGEPDPNNNKTYYRSSGDAELKLLRTDILNGSFEQHLKSWTNIGDTRVIKKLSYLLPTQGDNMSIISTGLGASLDSNSEISQNFIVPKNATSLEFDYNVISEEPMEYVGSKFDDTFIVQVYHSTPEPKIIATETINESTWHEADDIDFPGGDETTFQTLWKHVSYDVTAYRGQQITLQFWVYDKGDSIYDTAALIDNVYLKYE